MYVCLPKHLNERKVHPNGYTYIGMITMAIGTNIWNVETYRNKLENYHTVSVGMIWLEFSIE